MDNNLTSDESDEEDNSINIIPEEVIIKKQKMQRINNLVVAMQKTDDHYLDKILLLFQDFFSKIRIILENPFLKLFDQFKSEINNLPKLLHNTKGRNENPLLVFYLNFHKELLMNLWEPILSNEYNLKEYVKLLIVDYNAKHTASFTKKQTIVDLNNQLNKILILIYNKLKKLNDLLNNQFYTSLDNLKKEKTAVIKEPFYNIFLEQKLRILEKIEDEYLKIFNKLIECINNDGMLILKNIEYLTLMCNNKKYNLILNEFYKIVENDIN